MGVPLAGQHVRAGRTTSTTTALHRNCSFFDQSVFGKTVEVTSDCRRRQAKADPEIGSTQRSILGNFLQDPVAGP